MTEAVPTLTSDGLRRAAVLLMILDEESTALVLKQFGTEEVQRIARAMGHLRNVDRDEIAATLRDFLHTVREQSLMGESALGGARIRNILVNVLGPERASEIISKIRVLDRRAGGLKSLNRKEAGELAAIAKMQHPQIAAALLSQLEQGKALEVLGHLPEEMRRDLVVRVARLDAVSESALEELKILVAQHFDEESEVPEFEVGGLKMAAGLLNGLNKEEKQKIFNEIQSEDEELAALIEDSMFIFDDVIKIDDRSIQSLLAEVSSQTLVMALKGAEEQTKEKLLSNMSKRAAQMLRDDLEVGGPVKLSEVEAAQKEIVKAIRVMIDDGKIVIEGMGGGEALVG